MSARRALAGVLGAASYGLAIGLVHSPKFALRNVVKLPLLMATTGAVCALCYYVLARALCRDLELRHIASVAGMIFVDLAILLWSLTPVMLFLALTIRRPDAGSLHEYPWFLGAHVVSVAVCGSVALWRQARSLGREHGIARPRAAALAGSWLAVSLFVGAQASWYMRPFCGVATVDAPFMLSSQPDFRGATSFYEALWHLVQPPGSSRSPAPRTRPDPATTIVTSPN